MRRKLTALMALLTLTVAGAIAPTAAAQELEAEYIAGLQSDGTFLEVVSVSGTSAEECKSSTYQPVYDEKDGTCTLGYEYKPERLYRALSISLTPLGDNKYSFKFSALSFYSLKSEAKNLFSDYTLNFTGMTFAMPKGTTFSSGVEKATNDSNDKYDIYRWDDTSTYIYIKGTTTLDASAAQYITGNSDPSESESPTPTPTPTTESATPSPTSESSTPSATATALASNKSSDSNTALYIGIGVAVVILAAGAITAIVLVNKKKQPTGPTYRGPYPGAYPGGPGGPGAGFGSTGPGAPGAGFGSTGPGAGPTGPGAGPAMGAGTMGGPHPAGASGTGFGAPQGSYPGGYQPQPSSGQPQPYQPPSAPSAPSNQAPYNPGNQPPSAPYGPGNANGTNH